MTLYVIQVERWAEHCKEFFYLPEEKKMRYIRPNNENGGWVNRERERLSIVWLTKPCSNSTLQKM